MKIEIPTQLKREIYLSDATSFLSQLEKESVDLILIDPPYVSTKEKWDQVDAITLELCEQIHRTLKSSGNLYCWCGIGEKSNCLLRWMPIFNSRLYFKDLITWQKRRGIGMRKGWLYTREECLWYVKNNKEFYWNEQNQYSNEPNVFKKGMSGTEVKPFKRLTNVWTDIPEELKRAEKIEHYTPKQLELLRRIIRVACPPNGLTVDCFLGSGSTAIACAELGVNFMGCDIEYDFVKLSRKRLHDHGY